MRTLMYAFVAVAVAGLMLVGCEQGMGGPEESAPTDQPEQQEPTDEPMDMPEAPEQSGDMEMPEPPDMGDSNGDSNGDSES